jgi:dTDP-4-dehydrorhamnose 3,5-epimerase-like enzyme
MLDDCKIMDLPKHSDPRGNLSVIEGAIHVPFDIKRVYYLYDVPGGSSRAGHGHIELQQMIIAMSGSFDVIVDDGQARKKVHLNRSYYGLYIPGMMWREIENFSSGAVCLVLASTLYDPDDYYREYDDFAAAAASHRAQPR